MRGLGEGILGAKISLAPLFYAKCVHSGMVVRARSHVFSGTNVERFQTPLLGTATSRFVHPILITRHATLLIAWYQRTPPKHVPLRAQPHPSIAGAGSPQFRGGFADISLHTRPHHRPSSCLSPPRNEANGMQRVNLDNSRHLGRYSF